MQMLQADLRCLDVDTDWYLVCPVPGALADQRGVAERGVAGVADHHHRLAHAVHELDRGDDPVHRGAGVATRPHTWQQTINSLLYSLFKKKILPIKGTGGSPSHTVRLYTNSLRSTV